MNNRSPEHTRMRSAHHDVYIGHTSLLGEGAQPTAIEVRYGIKKPSWFKGEVTVGDVEQLTARAGRRS